MRKMLMVLLLGVHLFCRELLLLPIRRLGRLVRFAKSRRKLRAPTREDLMRKVLDGHRYVPHQGKREAARRMRQQALK